MVTKLSTLVDFRVTIISIAFWPQRQGETTGFLETVVATREWINIIHCIYAALMCFAPWAFVFLTIFLFEVHAA